MHFGMFRLNSGVSKFGGPRQMPSMTNAKAGPDCNSGQTNLC